MSQPKVINIKETRGRDLADDEVYIGRGGEFGNPFIIGQHGTREEVIDKFRKYFYGSGTLMDAVREKLKGKASLVCFCAPLPCHGDIYVEFLEKD